MAKSFRKTVSLFTLFSFSASMLGFFRESYIAYAYGAVSTTDAYYVSMVVPGTLIGILAQALTNSLVPTIRRRLTTSPGSVRRLINIAFWDSSILLIALCLTIYFFRGTVILVLAPGFTGSEHAEAVRLLSIMLFGIVFSGLTGTLAGINNVHERFVFPATMNSIQNVMFLAIAVLFGRWIGIESLAYGYLISVVFQFCVQITPIIIAGEVGLPKALWDPALKSVVLDSLTLLVSAGLSSISLIIDRMIASGLPGGRISDLNFALKLGLLPVGLVGASIASSLFPKMVSNVVKGEITILRNQLGKVLSIIIFVSLLFSVIFIVLGRQVLGILFLHGDFTEADVSYASGPLDVYGLFMFFYLIQPTIVRIFYARRKAMIITLATASAVILNTGLSLILVHPLGITGIVLGNALSMAILVIVLAFLLIKPLNIRMRSLERVREGVSPAVAFLVGVIVSNTICSDLLRHSAYSTVTRSLFIAGVSIFVGTSLLLVYSVMFRSNPVLLLFTNKLNDVRKIVR